MGFCSAKAGIENLLMKRPMSRLSLETPIKIKPAADAAPLFPYIDLGDDSSCRNERSPSQGESLSS
jgi:hypothetical protein